MSVNPLPGSLTQPYRILELIAISGEMPANQLYRLPGGRRYKEETVSRLKQEGFLLTYYKNGLRAYRLTARAKSLLLQSNPARFSFYLTGSTGTNHIKSEINNRLRLHRISESTITMMNADVLTFRDDKPPLFSPEQTDFSETFISSPAFYSSREIKELGTEFVKIRGARAVGVLLAGEAVHVVYNLGPALMKWNYKSEMRTKALMKSMLCRERLSHQYAPDAVRGLILGDSMELAYDLLTNKGGKNYFILDGSYENFCYLTNSRQGECILRLMCDADLSANLRNIMADDMLPPNPGLSVDNDAITCDGRPVLFAWDCNLPRIMRFNTAIGLQNRTGTLICFDFQSEALRRYCNDSVHIQTIDFEKFEGRFFT